MDKKLLTDFSNAFPDLSDDILKLNLLYHPGKMRIAVLGKYNHGKSTLLNAIIGQEIFKTGDIRTTKSVQKFFYNDIVWSDTPGLDADISGFDDQDSKHATNNADIILIVHSVKEGELDKNELQLIQSALKKLSVNKDKFILVLNQIEQIDSNDLAKIETAVFQQLSDMNCIVETVKISAQLYIKGKNENKAALEKMSNFSHLLHIIQLKKSRITQLRRLEFNELKAKIISQMDKKLKSLDNEISDLTAQREMEEFTFTMNYHQVLNNINFTLSDMLTEGMDFVLSALEGKDKKMKRIKEKETRRKIKDLIKSFEERWQTGPRLSPKIEYMELESLALDNFFEDAFETFLPREITAMDTELRIKCKKLAKLKKIQNKLANLNLSFGAKI